MKNPLLLFILLIFCSASSFNQPFHLIDDNKKMSYLFGSDINKLDRFVFTSCKDALINKIKEVIVFGKSNDHTVIRNRKNSLYPNKVSYQVMGKFYSKKLGNEIFICDVVIDKSQKGKVRIDYLDVGGNWELF